MNTLVERCQQVYAGAGEAIEWVNEVRQESARLDRNSDGLIDKLRRVRNLSTRLGRAASRPVSVGFFGLSQAGKSYLISAMAAGESGELETELDGQRLNFISHVNPPGGGKEATGLVTRFTRKPSDAPAGYPLELSVFSEVELVKVLGNAFFNDFDREQVEFDTSPAHIRKQLAALESRRQPRATGGVSEDNVVELLEYFEQRFPKSSGELKGDYWPTAIELAPYLEATDRGALFSILWGGLQDLTDTYLLLRNALAATGYADRLYCPISVLVSKDADGVWSQADSIMNVDILERLGRDNDDLIEVIPGIDGKQGEPVRLPRSMLAALTAELKFVLADSPRERLLEHVDLLDFPGYRGRLSVGNLDEVRRQLNDDQVDPVAQLVLRGKVAYLFERYTDDQEMNLLVLCAPSHKQSDVKDLGPVLETWVQSTQGAGPEQRARRKAGLLWTLTMFDFRLAPVPGQTLDLMRKGWEGMMKLAFLERFGAYNWVHEWSPGQPFNNLFLVRKPRMATAVIETDNQHEQRIIPNQQERLGQLRETFCAEPSVQKHFADPAAAWDAMLSFDDGGISRLVAYLGQVATPEVKLARIEEQLDEIAEDLIQHRFGAYYQREGAAEVGNKEQIAARVVNAVKPQMNRFGELLLALQPSREQLRALYLRTDDAADSNAADAGTASGRPPDTASPSLEANLFSGLDELLGASPANDTEQPPEPVDGASLFVRATLRHWFTHLQQLPEDPHWQNYLGIDKDVLELLVGELITGADRIGLEAALLDLIQAAEAQTAAKRARLAERQVYAVSNHLARYVDYLGFDQVALDERPRLRADAQRGIFAPPTPLFGRQMPELAEQPSNFSVQYIADWLEAFKSLAVSNAGHAAGRDISPQHNARLGEILRRFEANAD